MAHTFRFCTLARSALIRLNDNPQTFLALVSRRYLPLRVRNFFGTIATKKQPQFLRTLFALLADRTDLLPTGHTGRKNYEARQHWEHGNYTRAIALLPATSRQREKLEAEWALLTDSWEINLPAAPLTEHNIDALHVVTNSLPYTHNGYTTRTQRLLRAQTDFGLHVEATTRIGYPVTNGYLNTPDKSVIDGITYHHVIPQSLDLIPTERFTRQAELLVKLAHRLQPRVLHTTTEYRNAHPTLAAAHALDIPWVYEMRGQLENSWVARQAPEWQESTFNSERYKAWRETETRMASYADAVIVLSEVQQHDLIGRGIDETKIHILPNVFDWPDEVERLDVKEARSRLHLPEAALWFGTVTSVVDYEGLDTLIHALVILRERGIDARLAIVGDGIGLPALHALATEMGVSEYVTMPGRISADESHVWYQSLDVFAVPRRDTLVCRMITPLKPLEALACGTPVFVSDLPALRHIPDAHAGIAIAPDNPQEWARILEHNLPGTPTYDAMARHALRLSRKGSWAINAQKTVEIYRMIS